MANKRMLKKKINAMVFDVIDECLFIQENQEDKVQEAEQLIEQAVAAYNKMIEGVNRGKTKADFNAVWNAYYDASDAFSEQLNRLTEAVK